MDTMITALLLYGGGCVISCWLIRQDDRGELFRKYGILTRYQRVKEALSLRRLRCRGGRSG